jgi:translation initiation factor IF-2
VSVGLIFLYPLRLILAQSCWEIAKVFLDAKAREQKLIEKYNKLMTKLQSKDPTQEFEPAVDPNEISQVGSVPHIAGSRVRKSNGTEECDI